MQALAKEFLQILKERKLLVAIIAIIFVPILYAGMFLWAFWDPYDHLDDLPIAIVNEDVGTYEDGEFYEIGKELIDNLKEEDAFDLHFVDKLTGESGLQNEDYYILIEIPEQFSENALSVMDEHPKKAELIYIPNESYNFLASQMGETAMLQIEVALQEKITETYAETVFEKVSEVADGLAEASDATVELHDGSVELHDGSSLLKDNLLILKESSTAFTEGMDLVVDGTDELVTGSNELANGLQELDDASDQLFTASLQIEQGTIDLEGGSMSLHVGMEELYENMAPLIDGTEQVIEGLTMFKNELPEEMTAQVKNNVEEKLNDFSEQLKDFVPNIDHEIIDEILTEINELYEEKVNDIIAILEENNVDPDVIQTISQSLEQVAIKKEQIIATLEEKINEAMEKVNEKINEVKLTIDEKVNIVTDEVEHSIELATNPIFDELIGGMNTIQRGQEALYDGVAQLHEGTNDLNDGASKLKDGQVDFVANMKQFSKKMSDATNGGETLSFGAFALLDGMNELHDATLQIEDGTAQLADGAVELTDGLATLIDGTETFTSEMDDAASEVADIQTNKETYNMFATPVKVENEKVNEVPNYGTGFAPYFLSLGLFVGALLMSIVFPLREPALKPKNALQWFYSKFGVIVAIGVFQALLASGFLLIVLGLEVQSVPLFLLYSIITSLAFVTLIQFLVTCLEDPGRFIAILILIMQLTTSAGTFPLELIPKALQPLNLLFPMTYSVSGFKAVISSGDYSVMWQNAGVLLGFAIVSMLLTYSYFAVMHKRKFGKETNEEAFL